jgi:hypothetical protein
LSHDTGRQLSIFGLDVGTNKAPFLSNPLHDDPNIFTEMSNYSPPRSVEGTEPNEPLLEQSIAPSDEVPAPTTRRCRYTFPNIIQRQALTLTHSAAHRFSISLQEESAENEVDCVNSYERERKEVAQYMHETRMEIVVILEGVDPLTSHTVQAFHSYKSEDIEWDHFFAPCTFLDSDGWTVVDFMKFHNLIAVPSSGVYRPCSTSQC